MNKESKVLIDLINLAIYNKTIEYNPEIDWYDMKELARQHNCMAIIFPAVKKLQSIYNCVPVELYEQWEEIVVEIGAAQCIKNYELN